jgi:leucyl aminopeptidase
MSHVQHLKTDTQLVHIYGFTPTAWKQYLKDALTPEKAWTNQHGFTGKPRELCLVPDSKGHIVKVLYGKSSSPYEQFWDPAWLCAKLPPQSDIQGYIFAEEAMRTKDHAISWQLETYRFQRYKKIAKTFPTLYLPKDMDLKEVGHITQAIFLIRDLINTPAEDCTPINLAETAQKIAKQHKAKCTITKGKALEKACPLVHAVGKGASKAPTFTEIHWGNPKHPKIALIGKGVTFDTGGLDIKDARSMGLMKKDMGGAAHALALGQLIMSLKLPVNLTILLPSAENAVSGTSFRPSDIVKSRKGLTVEIGDTDAEGRLLLADALTRACEDKPQLIIDCATLTGAARVALGTEIPAVFSNKPKDTQSLIDLGWECHDPLWMLPIWQPYGQSLNSSIADTNNVGTKGYGGAITAALFLEKFVDRNIHWIHLDMMAWNLSGTPGRPTGGEAMGLRALLEYVKGYAFYRVWF